MGNKQYHELNNSLATVLFKLLLVLVLFLYPFIEAQAQNYFNKLIDLGYTYQSSHFISNKEDTIVFTGQGNFYNQDSTWAAVVFYVEVNSKGNVISQSDFDDPTYSQYGIDNSNIQDAVFVGSEFTSSFFTRNFSVIYKITNSEYEFLDTLINTFDTERPIAVAKLCIDSSDQILISGVTFEDNQNGSFTYPFLYNLDEGEYQNIYKNTTSHLRYGDIIVLDDSIILIQYDSNGDVPLSDTWGHQLRITQYDKNHIILNTWSSEMSEYLGKVEDAHYSEDGIIVSGIQFKQNGNSNFDLLSRIYTLRYSFENGVEWLSYPFGEEWLNSSLNEVNELIPSLEEDGFIVVGQKYVSDSTGNFVRGMIAKIGINGDVLWQKSLDSGLIGFHSIKDINAYSDGYILAGKVSNIENRPDSIPPIPTWLMYLNKDGEFSGTSKTIEKDVLNNSSIRIFPNPTSNRLEIECLAVNCKKYTTIEIFDLMGKRILSRPFTVNEQIDISDFKDGLYNLLFFHDKRLIVSRSFIKY